MALPAVSIRRTYPIPVYNYRVTIDGTAIACTEVTGLSLHYEPITYKHGLSWKEGTEHMPGQKQPVRITLRKGIVQNGGRLLEWIETVRQNKVTKRNFIIELCDENGQALVTWQVLKAFPLKLDAPGFNANSNEVAIESMELMAGDLNITFHT